MRANLDGRLSRLESASAPGRTVFIWEPDDDCDRDELKRRRGVAPNDKCVFIGWLSPGEITATE
jgi:hypothetical protein